MIDRRTKNYVPNRHSLIYEAAGNSSDFLLVHLSSEAAHARPKFSNNSDSITQPAAPPMSARVTFPPGTSSGILKDGDRESEYRSDHDIAAGRIPNSTSTDSTRDGKKAQMSKHPPKDEK